MINIKKTVRVLVTTESSDFESGGFNEVLEAFKKEVEKLERDNYKLTGMESFPDYDEDIICMAGIFEEIETDSEEDDEEDDEYE